MSERGLFEGYDTCTPIVFIDSDGGGDVWDNSRGSRWTNWMGGKAGRTSLPYDGNFFLVLPLEYLK